MTTYRNALCHNSEDDSSNNYQNKNRSLNIIFTMFIKSNEPKLTSVKYFSPFIAVHRHISVVSATIFRCHTRSHNVQIIT
jgi:hypothetical protein